MARKNQLRLDPLTGRWVAVSVVRSERPFSFRPYEKVPRSVEGDACPFCPESPNLTEIIAAKGEGAREVRVFKNKYPAFEGDEEFVVNTIGPVFTEAPSSGAHEVLVFSPDHAKDWAELDFTQLELVMEAIVERVREHASTLGLRYSQVIVNEGREAGASIEHPHAQILGLPFVPREVADEQEGFSRFTGGCLLCTTIAVEEKVNYRVVEATDEVVVICPFWSSVPYEMIVIPRHHLPQFHLSPEKTIKAAGWAIREALRTLRALAGPIAYNVVFHSGAFRLLSPYHWHVHVLPKLTTRAGFELGTGIMINVVCPEEAAEQLRKSAEKASVG